MSIRFLLGLLSIVFITGCTTISAPLDAVAAGNNGVKNQHCLPGNVKKAWRYKRARPEEKSITKAENDVKRHCLPGNVKKAFCL